MSKPTAKTPGTVLLNGNELKCVVCGHDAFVSRYAQMNTRAASFFNLDWANPSAECYICNACGYVHWFAPDLRR